MWNAPSDRKYCGQFDDDDEICLDCGAHGDQPVRNGAHRNRRHNQNKN